MSQKTLTLNCAECYVTTVSRLSSKLLVKVINLQDDKVLNIPVCAVCTDYLVDRSHAFGCTHICIVVHLCDLVCREIQLFTTPLQMKNLTLWLCLYLSRSVIQMLSTM